MADGLACGCFRRLREIQAAGDLDMAAVQDLTEILRCTQFDACPDRHDCSEKVRELIESVMRP